MIDLLANLAIGQETRRGPIADYASPGCTGLIWRKYIPRWIFVTLGQLLKYVASKCGEMSVKKRVPRGYACWIQCGPPSMSKLSDEVFVGDGLDFWLVIRAWLQICIVSAGATAGVRPTRTRLYPRCGIWLRLCQNAGGP